MNHTQSTAFHARSSTTPVTEQRIPRRIFQTVASDAASYVRASPILRAWRELNPEYDHHLFEEADCQSFVNRAASTSEQWAYARLATGAGRADLFRVLVLWYLGGVYADVDVDVRRPLRTAVPATSSLVLAPRISSELLISVAAQPVLAALAREFVQLVRIEVGLWRNASRGRCTNARTCVLDITGPRRLRHVVCALGNSLGCSLSPRYPHFRGCASSSDEVARSIVVCKDEDLRTFATFELDKKTRTWVPSQAQRGWDCGIANHLQCAKSRRTVVPSKFDANRSRYASRCAGLVRASRSDDAHYSTARRFFHF